MRVEGEGEGLRRWGPAEPRWPRTGHRATWGALGPIPNQLPALFSWKARLPYCSSTRPDSSTMVPRARHVKRGHS